MHAFFESLAARANIRGAETALVSAAGTVSYAQLIERVRGHAQWARPLPSRVGLLFSKGPEQILADLALSFAGKELVPLPDFFSDAQIRHIIHATQLSEIVADPHNLERAARLGVKVHTFATAALPNHGPADDAGRIIFTSGTTGKPKGVCLRGAQVLASVAAMAQASGAASSDRYLSVLPSALLLEQIAGTYLPLSVGAMICVSEGGTARRGWRRPCTRGGTDKTHSHGDCTGTSWRVAERASGERTARPSIASLRGGRWRAGLRDFR